MWKEVPEAWPYILHPRPVAVVVSGDWNDYSAMPASWITPVSRKPPILAVAIARSRYTYEKIVQTKEFGVCILEPRYVKQVHYLGTVSGRDVKDKIVSAGLSKVKAKAVRCPLIAESIAAAECKVIDVRSYGDHDLVVGEVIHIYVREGIEVLNPSSYRVLLHVGRDLYTKPVEAVLRP